MSGGEAAATYEAVVRQILGNLRERLGVCEVRGPARYRGRRSGARWSIEASCHRVRNGALVLVECRRKTTSRVKQEEVAGFAYRVRDIGAAEGLMVTPVGYQRGARIVAGAERIGMAILNADATESEYFLRIADRLFRGLRAGDIVSIGLRERALVRRTCACGRRVVSRGDGTFYCPRCDGARRKKARRAGLTDRGWKRCGTE